MRLRVLPSTRTAGLLLAGLVVLSAAGCGRMVEIAYNNADTMLRRTAQEYFDLSPPQVEFLGPRLAALHQWHREAELPCYSALLDEMARRTARGLDGDDVEWALARLRTHYERLVEQAALQAAPVRSVLHGTNLDALERKLEESNAKLAREFHTGDARADSRARAARLEKQVKRWTGDLHRAQEVLVKDFADAAGEFAQFRFDERKRRQQAVVSLLRQQESASELAAGLRDVLMDWRIPRDAEAERIIHHWEEETVRFLLELDRTLSPAQRARVVARLGGYAKRFATLGEQGTYPASSEFVSRDDIRHLRLDPRSAASVCAVTSSAS